MENDVKLGDVTQLGVDILEALGVDLAEQHVTRVVLTVEAGAYPTLEVTRSVYQFERDDDLRSVVETYLLTKREDTE
jgi:hypothetical protein